MPTRDIKTKFVLEGEQEYKRSMTDAANAIKVLNSEQKLAKAQFEATGDSEQYAAEQTRILKEQIEQQKRAVEAAENALKKLTENGVDKNSKQVQNWRTKLNNAKTSLLNMQTRLDKVGTELQEEATEFGKTETAGDNFDESLKKIGKGVDFQNTILAIDNITDHIEKIIRGAARAAKALWDMGVDAAQYADNVATAASQMGVDPETYQSWVYASRFVDTSVEDIQRSWQDIQKKLKEDNTDYLATLAKMGIASRKAAGQMRESSDIFWDAIDYLHGLSDASAQAAAANELFGNDWRRLMPLIEAGSKAYKERAEEGKQIAVVSNENITALGEVDDKIQKVGAQFDALKYNTLAELAPTFSTVADALSKAITALNEFVQSEEGQQALADLNEALSGIVDSFLGEDNGKGSFTEIVNGAKEAVTQFTTAMDWISKNGEAITKTIEGLGIAWATLKVTKEVLSFLQLLKQIPLSKLTSIFGSGKASAEGMDNASAKMSNAARNAANKTAEEQAARAAADSAVKSAEDSAAAAQSAAKASADSSASSAQSAAESGAASSSAAAESAASSSASAAAASEAAIESATASKIAAESAAMRAAIGAGGGALLGGGATPSLNLPWAGGQPRLGSGSGGLSGLLPAGAGAKEAAIAVGSTLAKSLGFFGILAGMTLAPTKTGNNDLWDAAGNPTDEARSVGITWRQNEYTDEDASVAWRNAQAEKEKAEAMERESKAIAKMEAAQNYWDAYRNPDTSIDDMMEKSAAMREAFADDVAGFYELMDQINEFVASGTFDSMEELPADLPAAWFGYGEDAAIGLANGIDRQANQAISAASALARSVSSIVTRTLMIKSPSRVMAGLGEFVSLGFAEGIENEIGTVERAASRMASATMTPVAASAWPQARFGGQGGYSSDLGGGSASQPIVKATIVMDKQIVGEMVAPVVNNTIGAVVATERV